MLLVVTGFWWEVQPGVFSGVMPIAVWLTCLHRSQGEVSTPFMPSSWMHSRSPWCHLQGRDPEGLSVKDASQPE